MGSETRSFQAVVVGSSAGGIDALSTLVATLPAEFPVPVVLAQHLSPDHPSHLTEILGKQSALPVRTVQNLETLEPGTIYVVPANRHVELTDHSLALHENGRGRPKPSIDLLLSTAAEVFGEKLIAVILTGTGSDGADGAREVKLAGGTVIIQNPETAAHPEMPLSLAPTTVDITADIDSIGPLLQSLVTGSYSPKRPEEQDELRKFLQVLRERSGLDFTAYKQPTILRRLQRRMAATGTDNLQTYSQFVKRHPDEYQRLISSFLIKVTQFFRDPELFNYLHGQVLPKLLDTARERQELRLWSAGCATGEEAYSLAILVADMLDGELEEITVRIFATDLDSDAVAFARRGIFPAAALAGLSAERIAKYFIEVEGGYEVTKMIRNMVVFGRHDLGQRAPFPRIDLLMCRNVLIYFTPELQKRALQVFAFSVQREGYLVLGKAETVSALPDAFSLTEPSLKVFRRIGGRIQIPPIYSRDPIATSHQSAGNARTSALPATALHRSGARRTLSNVERTDGLMERLPIGVVVVDRQYDIEMINAAARRLLGIHTSAIGEDFIHLVQNASLTPLRDAIDEAFEGQSRSGVYPVETAESVMGELWYLEITCYSERSETTRGDPLTVTILVSDATDVRQANAERQRFEKQVERLMESNRQLLAANQELTSVNARLRGSNEELLVANEEAQASGEEVETLNEEFQATNEELETLNEELQATVEELNTTNDDLEARGAELLTLTVSKHQRRGIERQREQFAAVLTSMGDGVLVVDVHGDVIISNATYDETFGDGNLIFESEPGLPLGEAGVPRQRAARGESFNIEFTFECPDGSRRWYEATGTQLVPGEIQGGVVVFRDMTERSIRRLQDQFMAMASHELRTPLTALHASLQMIQRQLRDTERKPVLDRYLSVAEDQIRRMRGYVDDLMDVARLQSGRLVLELEPVDLLDITRRAVATVQMLTDQRTITLDAPRAATVLGESRRLEQVLLNILNNAITYSPDGGEIAVRLLVGDDRVSIGVHDDGPGIPADDVERIFSRFSQLDGARERGSGGLGLGLYIANEIVTSHHGDISVESEEGEGTTFTIHLPQAAR